MEQVMGGVRRFSQWGLWFGGALNLVAVFIIAADILMRRFLNTTVGGADELAGYALAIGTAWGLGAALVDRAHIRIDSLNVLFPRKLRLLLDVAALVLFIAFFGTMTWYGFGVLEQSWMSGSRSRALEIPTVIPQVIWFLGMLGFIAIGVLLLAYALQRGLAGDLKGMESAISTRSVEEDVEAEIRDIEERRERAARG